MTKETLPPIGIVEKLIATIEPLKVKNAKRKHEQFVNVGIEATKRLFTDNKELIANRIQAYATQETALLQAENERLTLALDSAVKTLRNITTVGNRNEYTSHEVALIHDIAMKRLVSIEIIMRRELSKEGKGK